MNIKVVILFLMVAVSFSACNHTITKTSGREQDFNFDWKFHLGDVAHAAFPDFKDDEWRAIRLPHDWSVEHSFTQENTAGATAFLPGGIGWYRKTFKISEKDIGKATWIVFDGIYTNSEVWINGHYLGKHPYGYGPFWCDLTKYLQYGQGNVIAVKVDRSAYIDCRWYPGSGIYRNVRLVTTGKVHVPEWGVYVTTPEVSSQRAIVNVQSDVVNQAKGIKNISVVNTLYFGDEEVARAEKEVVLAPLSTKNVGLEMQVPTPHLWDTENPNLYKVMVRIYLGEELIDEYSTSFGIRYFHFDPNEGFSLNGKHMLIKGVCLHHDAGLVGAAVPDGVWERRLRTLKEGGCNAIRTSHNPPSAAFLALCDRLGFLVQDEAFDEWDNPKDKHHNYNQQEADPLTAGFTQYFAQYAEQNIKNMVQRDRNHPSIIMWSIGNEIEWTYPRYGNATGYWGKNKVGDVNYYFDEPPLSIDQIKENFEKQPLGAHVLAKTAANLSHWVKEMDRSRPVTANTVIPSVSCFSGYSDVLDIVGLSYRHAVYDYLHKNYPEKIFLGTENWTRYHEWEPVVSKPFISGIFLWTGIDYMGESKHWPVKGSGSGLLDFAGFKKPSYYMFKTLWSDDPSIYITTQVLEKSPYKWDDKDKVLIEKEQGWARHQLWGWQPVNHHWNYQPGEKIAVEVYTNTPAVELLLNGKSLGVKKLDQQQDHILKWMVPYVAGELSARAVADPEVKTAIQTAGEFNKLLLTVDKQTLNKDGYDVAHVIVQLADEKGVPVRHINREVKFHVVGNARVLGVDNGAADNIQDYQNDKLTTSRGRALMILQSNTKAGSVKVKAVADNIESKEMTIEIR